MEPESHLSEFTILYADYDRVSHMKRLGNYIIDLIVFYIVIIFLGAFLGFIFPDFFSDINFDDPIIGLWDRFFTLVFYALYMGISETIFKGRSIGKFATGTRVVNLDGSAITARTAFLRGLSRAVPFAAISALGSPSNPWQDKWTNTMVVKNIKQLDL